MDLGAAVSALALLNSLTPESNACSDMQKTGIEVVLYRSRYKYGWHFDHCCACYTYCI
jgi:hypothetical protein